jgi:Family of unknown function (DUF6174)
MKNLIAALLAASLLVTTAATSSLAAVQTAPEPQDLTLKSLSRLEATWRAHKPARYSFTIERSCFCAPRVLSASFQVTGATSELQTSSALSAKAFFQPYVSVDKLFGVMRQTLQSGGRVAVVWDAKRGTPVQITLDRNVQTTDDELYLTVSKFVAR